MTALRAAMLDEATALEGRLRDACDEHRESARNLAHYIALRRHDIRDLEEKLTAQGLSSLGRAEADVLCAVDALLRLLHRLAGRPGDGRAVRPCASFDWPSCFSPPIIPARPRWQVPGANARYGVQTRFLFSFSNAAMNRRGDSSQSENRAQEPGSHETQARHR